MLKKFGFVVLGILFSCVFIIYSNAYALSIAYSEAYIDWSSLEITTDPDMTIEWTENIGSSSGAWSSHNSILKDYQYDAWDDWSDTSSSSYFSNSAGDAAGDAYTDDEELGSYTSASSDLGGSFNGDAAAYRWGSFMVLGDGTISFSADYYLYHYLYESLPRPTEMSTAYSSAGLYLGRNDGEGEDSAGDSIWTPNWDPPLNGYKEKYGTLTVSLNFNDGDTGYFQAGVASPSEATSAVPEPASLSLLSIGLLGLAGLRKKKVT